MSRARLLHLTLKPVPNISPRAVPELKTRGRSGRKRNFNVCDCIFASQVVGSIVLLVVVEKCAPLDPETLRPLPDILKFWNSPKQEAHGP